MSSDDYAVIDLAERERDLVRHLVELSDRADIVGKPYSLHFVHAAGPFGVLGRSVEAQVFYEQFGNERELLADEYGPFESASIFILVVDHQKAEVAGSIRVIEHSPLGLKTLRDIESQPDWGRTYSQIDAHHSLGVPQERVWDVATLAVRRGWRASDAGSLASISLYHGVFLGSLIAGIDALVVALDDAVAQLMIDFGMPWQRICDLPPISFLDSPATSPLLLDMRGLSGVLGTASPIGRMICFGDGLEETLSRPIIPADGVPCSPAELDRRVAAMTVGDLV